MGGLSVGLSVAVFCVTLCVGGCVHVRVCLCGAGRAWRSQHDACCLCSVVCFELRRAGSKPYTYWLFNDMVVVGTVSQEGDPGVALIVHKRFPLTSVKVETPKELRDKGLLLRDTVSGECVRLQWGRKEERDLFKREVGRLVTGVHTLGSLPSAGPAASPLPSYDPSRVPRVPPPCRPPLPPPPPFEDRPVTPPPSSPFPSSRPKSPAKRSPTPPTADKDAGCTVQ